MIDISKCINKSNIVMKNYHLYFFGYFPALFEQQIYITNSIKKITIVENEIYFIFNKNLNLILDDLDLKILEKCKNIVTIRKLLDDLSDNTEIWDLNDQKEAILIKIIHLQNRGLLKKVMLL